MSRRKTAKRTTQRQTTNKSFAAVQKMEKDFLQAPAKLAAQLNKEISPLKQKESKLKTAINKIREQLKNSEKRIQTAKTKPTSIGKKQLHAAKKGHSNILKTHITLNKQLQEITKSLETVAAKQAKFIALRKHLNQFKKEWAKEAKIIKTKANTKIKTKAPTKRTSKLKTSPIEHPQTEHVERMMDETRFDETTEATS
jgi:hypothetical protein